MTRYGLVIDARRCTGCDVCVKACKDEYIGNDFLPWSRAQPEPSYTYYKDLPGEPDQAVADFAYTRGHNWVDVLELVRGNFPWVDVTYMPLPCMHCDNPPCMAAFPGNIYMRPDGIVIIDPQETAPPEIVDSCPYGTIYYNEQVGIGQKDTLDAHRVDEGKNPKYVDACPLKVFTFGDLDDPTSEVSQLIATEKTTRLREDLGTEPKVFYIAAPTPTVAGYLMDNSTKLDVKDVTVTLTNLLTGETVMAKSDHAGNFSFEGLENRRTYTVRVEAPGYYPRMKLVYVRGDGFRHIGTWRMLPKLFPR